MIQPDAKCVVNGAKVNEAIMALNPLLAMSVGYIGGGKPPQVTYSDGEVKILLPLADSVDGFSLEELDIVDTNNAASSRYFMTSTDSVSTYGTTTASTSGTPTGKQSTSQPRSKGRNSLGNTPSNNNRDQLSMNTGGALRDSGGGVAPTGNVTGGAQPNIMAAAAPGLQQQPAIGGVSGGAGGGNMIRVGGGGQAPRIPTSTAPTTPTAPTSQPIAPTTEPTALPPAGISAPPPAPSSGPITSNTTAGTDAEFVDWRAAEKVRIKQRITAKNEALRRLVSSGASQDQISAARAEISALIMEYDRVSKL